MNPWFPDLLRGVSFPGAHCFVASLKEFPFWEPMVPQPPSGSAFLRNPLFCGLP
jgi:hypothetical protein